MIENKLQNKDRNVQHLSFFFCAYVCHVILRCNNANADAVFMNQRAVDVQ